MTLNLVASIGSSHEDDPTPITDEPEHSEGQESEAKVRRHR